MNLMDRYIQTYQFDQDGDEDEYDEMCWELCAHCRRINPVAKWIVKGENMGWQKRSGMKIISGNCVEDIFPKIFPHTSISGTMDLYPDRIIFTIGHHDAPMGGEVYTLLPLPEGGAYVESD